MSGRDPRPFVQDRLIYDSQDVLLCSYVLEYNWPCIYSADFEVYVDNRSLDDRYGACKEHLGAVVQHVDAQIVHVEKLGPKP